LGRIPDQGDGTAAPDEHGELGTGEPMVQEHEDASGRGHAVVELDPSRMVRADGGDAATRGNHPGDDRRGQVDATGELAEGQMPVTVDEGGSIRVVPCGPVDDLVQQGHVVSRRWSRRAGRSWRTRPRR
jgi:hypothetical protein